MTYRQYQEDLKATVRQALAEPDVHDVMAVMFTGGGKTKTFTDLMAEYPGYTISIAHRQELVVQMSMAFAREGIRHAVIGSAATMSACMAAQTLEYKRHFVDPNSRTMVAGVDTLVRAKNDPRFLQVQFVVLDEGHHVTVGSKWHKARQMFPNAKGLLVTATPLRSDGKGLGRHADGIVDRMVLGPPARWLIDQKYLTDYRIFAPPSDIDLSDVGISASGDFSPKDLSKAVHKSRIVGDVVAHYMRIAPGQLGITFAVDIEAAIEICTAYRAAGIAAEVITGETDATLRTRMMGAFHRGEIRQMVSVDVLGEGVDVPAVEVVSFARPTASYGLYVQQFGRVLRLMAGKERATVIDHVGNVKRHGLPDAPRKWSLDRRERASKSAPSDAVPTRTCPGVDQATEVPCLSVYERALPACPYCGHVPVPARRDGPEFVDGDLHELDAATLARLRGDIAAVDSTWCPVPVGAGHVVAQGIRNRHSARQMVQAGLRDAIALWGGWKRDTVENCDDAMQQRLFFFRFGIDTGTACTLGAADAEALRARVQTDLDDGRIIAAVVN